MRVTSELFVSALVRRIERAGGFAAILRRGARDAGAVFIVERMRSGEVRLYRPAPQALYDTGAPADRRFVHAVDCVGQEELDSSLQREVRFDSDVWIVEVEPPGDVLETYLDVTMP
jgi:hypothetical protein